MLRRRFMSRVGVLMCAFVAGLVVAIWALQNTLAMIDHANADAAFLMDGVQTVGLRVKKIEAERFGAASEPGGDDAAAQLRDAIAAIGKHAVACPGGSASESYQRLVAILPAFLAAWRPERGAAAADQADLRADPGTAVLETGLSMDQAVQELGRAFRAHVAEEQRQVGRTFRTMVLMLTLSALVMVNVAIHVLLRTAQMVLKPVGALVAGSRELAAGRFDHRVHVDRADEFGELAHAYNELAAQLQATEERKAETLRQLAVTLNHDLNNAMLIIELQLGLLDRRSGGNPAQATHLQEIRTGLARMATTVASLKNIRRVVLTDYVPGQKMIDLERSVAESSDGDSGREDRARSA